MSFITKIAKSSAYLTTSNILSSTINAVSFVLIARLLTKSEMGATVALMLIEEISQLFSDLGFGGSIVKYTSEYLGSKGDYVLITTIGAFSRKFFSLLIAVVVFVSAPWLSMYMLKSADYVFLFQLISLDIIFSSLKLTINNILLGLGRVRDMASLTILFSALRYGLAVWFLLLGMGLYGWVIGLIIGDVVCTLLGLFILLSKQYIRFLKPRDLSLGFKMLIKFSWPLFMSSIVMFLYKWFDQAILLAYVQLPQLAVYRVAIAGFTIVYSVLTSVSMALFSFYGEQYGMKKHETIERSIRLSSRYIALAFIPLAIGLAAVANPTISIFAGSMYEEGSSVLAILSIFGAFAGVGSSLGGLVSVYEMPVFIGLILVYGMPIFALLITSIPVLAALSIAPLVLPVAGINGMAFIKGLAMLASFILTVLILRRRISITFDLDAVWKSLVSSAVMFVTVTIVEKTMYGIFFLPFYVFVGAVVYLLSLRELKAVNEEDFQLLRTIVGDKFAALVNVLRIILLKS